MYGYSDATKGLIAAGFSVGYCLGLLPTGAAASAGSPKSVLLGGLVVWSLAQTLTPAAAAVPSLQAVAARFVPAPRRSLFWGCLTASLSCGTLGAYTLSPPLIADNGWEYVF